MDYLHSMFITLEEKLDVEQHRRVLDTEEKVLRFEPLEQVSMRVDYPSRIKTFGMRETHEDLSKMLYNELAACLPAIESGSALPMIRANYGVGTLPSLFGAQCKIVNDSMPWVTPMPKDAVREIIDRGVPDLDTGFGKKLSLTHEYYLERLDKYPKCRECIPLYHPDFQGSLDVAHLIYGTDIYLDMYDDPDFVHALMGVVTDTYIAIMKRSKAQINDERGENCFHWSHLYGGHVVVRNDTAVNLSAQQYKEFVRPYDEKILAAFGGGSIHFCGKADQWLDDMLETKNLKAMNFGYLEKFGFGNSYLQKIGSKFAARRMPIVDYAMTVREFEEMDFKPFHDGISFSTRVADLAQGLQIRKRAEKLL